jgi:hypothetical protein
MNTRLSRCLAGVLAVASVAVAAGPAFADSNDSKRNKAPQVRVERPESTSPRGTAPAPPTTVTMTTTSATTNSIPDTTTTTLPGSVDSNVTQVVLPDVSMTVDGQERPINRKRERNNDQRASKVVVRTGSDLASGVKIEADGATALAVSVEGFNAQRGKAEQTATGTIVYRDALPAKTDVEVTVTDEKVQLAVDIEKKQAPTSFRFRFDGSQLHKNDDGSVAVLDANGNQVSAVDKPWATDANGAAVPTWYEVDGSTLIQHVNHENAAYPVKADPSVGLGWYVYLRFSPNDQNFIIGAGAVVVPVIVCAITAGTACTVAIVAAGVIAAWVNAYYHPRCWVEFKFTYWGGLAGFNRYWRC